MQTFAAQLRSARISAGFSQEELAEAARVSASAIGAYERGVRTAPHRDTIALLADALRLCGPERTAFENAGRRKPTGESGSAGRAPTNNLPLEANAFIARSDEVDQIAELLRQHRLVTLTGTGGIGKTRTALHVARGLLSKRRSICFVDLSPLRVGELVGPQIAAALDIPPSDRHESADGLANSLKGRDVLLLLDNCEHLIETVSMVASAISRTCENVTILSTSRERLRVAGEVVYRLAALPMPRDTPSSVGSALQFGAIELFVRRSMSAERTFVFEDALCGPVFEICRHLGGIPLAIELASSHVGSFGIAELLRHLEAHLSVQLAGSRDLPTRQQTMQATLEWSHALLTAQEQVLFRRLSVFANGWTVDGAVRVCSYGELAEQEAFHGLLGLTEKSLVVADTSAQFARYRMLELTRDFAEEKAEKASEASRGYRHAAWVAELADRACDEFSTTARSVWRLRYDIEIDNVRKALEWALSESGDPLAAARILAGFRWVWTDAGRVAELRRFAEAALLRLEARDDSRALALVLLTLTYCQSGLERFATAERAVSVFTRDNDPIGAAEAFSKLGAYYASAGSFDDALASLDQAVSLYEQSLLAHSLASAYVYFSRAIVLHKIGRMGDAERDISRVLELAEAFGEDFFATAASALRAETYFYNGKFDAAIDALNRILESKDIAWQHKFRFVALSNRACYKIAAGDLDGAYVDAAEVLSDTREFDPTYASFLHPHVMWAIQTLAAIGALRGYPARAAKLLGKVDVLLSNATLARSKTEQPVYELLLTSLGEQLNDDTRAMYIAEGAGLSIAAAVEMAILGDDVTE